MGCFRGMQNLTRDHRRVCRAWGKVALVGGMERWEFMVRPFCAHLCDKLVLTFASSRSNVACATPQNCSQAGSVPPNP